MPSWACVVLKVVGANSISFVLYQSLIKINIAFTVQMNCIFFVESTILDCILARLLLVGQMPSYTVCMLGAVLKREQIPQRLCDLHFKNSVFLEQSAWSAAKRCSMHKSASVNLYVAW